jgi:predicted glycoside hydrolase/deacetylase ChbG (UPF0249 family)
MLIINADDWGRNEIATNRILECLQFGTVSSTSAMVFMPDSERAAALAVEKNVDAGLHLNFTEDFSTKAPAPVRYSQGRIARFLRRSKFALILPHPFLAGDFEMVFKAQLDEFEKLYGKAPSHFDGHQHMHLCTNMLVQKLIPSGSIVRRSFSFARGEKSVLNRLYRDVVDRQLGKSFVLTDFFFNIPNNVEHLAQVVSRSVAHSVEMMVHPERTEEHAKLLAPSFASQLASVKLGNFLQLR